MQERRGSIFHKILLTFVLLGLLPTLLTSARLLTLNHRLLESGGVDWSLPGSVTDEITKVLINETTAYLIYTFLITGLVALFLAGGLIGPLHQLQQIVERFRKGEIVQDVEINTGDEIEDLALSFTKIARELIQLKQDLEARIAERTRDMERRALQLQIAAQVARDAATVNELDKLLERAVNLICDRFGYYHVGIFLVDEMGENAILRSGTGEAGRVLFQRGFKLKVGGVSIIGHVSKTGEARVVNDVTTDFAYYRDPLLPDTRSEMALPLKMGERIIGVLDVQSSENNAFSQEDVSAMQIMADQLAVAIRNARLLGELQTRLNEISTLYRRYIRESWSHILLGDKPIGYEYDLSRVAPVKHDLRPDIRSQLMTGQAITCKTAHMEASEETSSLVVPLMLHDRMIGIIGLEEDSPEHEWTPDEIALVEAIANQVSLALDNARLVEESRLRADQIRLLQEITSTAASHVDIVDLLDNVCQKLRAGFDLLHCSAGLVDQDGKAATLIANASVNPFLPGVDVVGTKIPIEGNNLIQQVMQASKSVVVYDVQNNPLTAPIRDLERLRGTNTLVIVPLFSRDEVVGIINMDLSDPNRRFLDEDLRLLDQVSMQISSAVEVTLGFEQTQRRAEQERRMSEIGARVRGTLDLETILKTASQEARRALGLQKVVVRLGVPDSDESGEGSDYGTNDYPNER